MAEKEIWVYLLAYNLIRQAMVQAARKCRIEPRFTASLTSSPESLRMGLPPGSGAHVSQMMDFSVMAGRRQPELFRDHFPSMRIIDEESAGVRQLINPRVSVQTSPPHTCIWMP